MSAEMTGTLGPRATVNPTGALPPGGEAGVVA